MHTFCSLLTTDFFLTFIVDVKLAFKDINSL